MKVEQKWKACARRMAREFNREYEQHVKLRDPWWRAAQSMAASWNIRASQAQRLPKRPRTCPRPKPQSWTEAACRMAAAFNARARDQALQGTWEYWAAHRPRVTQRYIRKRRNSSIHDDYGRASCADS
jgi:hypothetical protein